MLLIQKTAFFMDDIVLIEKPRNEVSSKLEFWIQSLESVGFLVSRSKTKYMYCSLIKK